VVELGSASVGGVSPTLPVEAGDFREVAFSGSAECCRLSYSYI